MGRGVLYFEPLLDTPNILKEEKECLLRHIIKENHIRNVQSVPVAWLSFYLDSYQCLCNLLPENTELPHKHFLPYQALVTKLLLNTSTASVASRTVCTLIGNSNFSQFSWTYDNRK